MSWENVQPTNISVKNALVEVLNALQWPIQEGKTPDSVVTKVQVKNGVYTCVGLALEDKQQMLFYSVSPTPTPPDKLSQISEFLHRANYGLHIGNFELDFRDGEIRFKTSFDNEGDVPKSALYKTLLMLNVRMIDKYYPGIQKVISGIISPADAIAEIESQNA